MSDGTQYAARSAAGLQVVAARCSRASVEYAFVETLPKKVWRCDSPGCPGRTIGSSPALWLNRQLLQKLLPCSFAVAARGDPAGEVEAATAAAAPAIASNERRLTELIATVLSPPPASGASGARFLRARAAPAPTRTRARGKARRRRPPGLRRRRRPSSRSGRCPAETRRGAQERPSPRA